MRATRAIIHLEHFKKNLEAIRQKIGPHPFICLPVKADAYGHGAVRIAIAALQMGVKYLAVASVQEGIELRQAGIVAPILLFSLPIPEEIPDLVRYRLTPLVSDGEFCDEFARHVATTGECRPVHLKIDTGMGRIGCQTQEAPSLVQRIHATGVLRLEGTATHFAVADSLLPEDIQYTQKQIRAFKEAIERIRDRGYDPGILHAANSGAVVLHEESYFDMVRPGLLAYGYPPIKERAGSVPVRPVMELQSRVVFIKRVPRGTSISYGRTWQAPQDTTIITIPVGYADGLVRGLSGKFSVFIQGALYPQVGRICMDQCMVDVGPMATIQRWDVVSLFGGPPPCPSAADLAEQLGTIPYEITCGINKRVPRVYVE